ncbi:MAG TPA: hypothetical protein EYP98_10880 [Planctomycetes bacterium]|nr:hypothetical protein [Planctomycetota bacterium]
MILSLRRCILLSLFAVASANAQDRIESTDALFPGALDPLDRSWVLSRVVDDLTGAPIANAAVYFVRESDTPLAGEFWFTRKVQTDKDGWLRAPVADIERKWHIQVLRHRDYGVAARVGQGGDIWRVGRPFDVPVWVRDWQGRPATGATIGFCGGCGHTPDLVNAVTDANGIAILKQIDPHSDIGDVYVQRTGLGLGYDSVRWMPGAPPVATGRRQCMERLLTTKATQWQGPTSRPSTFIAARGRRRRSMARSVCLGGSRRSVRATCALPMVARFGSKDRSAIRSPCACRIHMGVRPMKARSSSRRATRKLRRCARSR